MHAAIGEPYASCRHSQGGGARGIAMPTRANWMLRFVAGSDADPDRVDVILLMKGMFLFQHEYGAPEVDYQFRPSDHGPVAEEVYRDLKTLQKVGFVSTSRVPGLSYRIAEAGRRQLATGSFDPRFEAGLLALRTELSRMSFSALLRRVHASYPEFAEQEDRLFRELQERHLARHNRV